MKENLHTIKLIDVIVSEDLSNIFLVTNYVCSDLKIVLKQENVCISQKHTITILFRMLCALNFLQKANILHRDIKPENILLDNDCNLLICDFGTARSAPKIETPKKSYSREAMTNKLI